MTVPVVESLFVQFRSSGDSGALASVFDRVAPELARVACYLANGDAQAAADLMQATWLGAIERAATWDQDRPLVPWLLGILANQSRSQRREARRVRTGPDAELLGALLANDDPVRASADGEFARLLAAALAELAPPFREVVTLHVQHGLTAKEIGEALGRPAGTVRTQIVRGLDRLRALLPAGLAMTGAATVTLTAQQLARVREVVLAEVPTTSVPQGAWGAGAAVLVAVALVVVGWLGLRQDGPTLSANVGVSASPVVAMESAEPPLHREAVDVPTAVDVAPPQEPKPRRRITVHVRRDEEPKAVAGELVALAGMGGEPRFAVTDAAGDAVFDDVSPSMTWWVYLSGVESNTTVSSRRLPPPDSFVLEATLEVRGGKALCVRVLDAAGKPLADAEVHGNGMQRTQRSWLPLGRTDANGELHLRNQTLAQYRARASGHATSAFAEPRLAGVAAEVVLQMAAPIAPLQGRVLDVDGKPVAAELGTYEFAGSAMAPWFDRTKPDGSFTFDWLGVGHVAFVARVVDAKGTRVALVRTDVPRTEPLEIRLQLAASITVSTSLADGSRAAGETVRARLLTDGSFELPFCNRVTRTGADGRATIGGLPSGRWLVLADFGQAEVKRIVDLAPGGDVTWDVIAPALQPLLLRVLDERGAPLEGWRVGLLDAKGQSLPLQGVTTDTGELHPGTGIRLLPDQPFTIVVCEAYEVGGNLDYPTHRLPGQVADGRRIDVVVPDRSRTAHRLRGRVLDTDGKPVAGNVRAVSQLYWWSGTTEPIGADGTFALGPFPPGRLAIVVQREGKPDYRLGRIEIPIEGDRDLGNVVLAPERRVRASPAERAAVPNDVRLELVREDGSDSYDVDRDSSGTFMSDEVPPGRYLLRGSGRTHCVGAVPVTVGATDVEVTFRCEVAPTLRIEIPLTDEERAQAGWSGPVILRRGGDVIVRRSIFVRFNGRVPTPFTVQVAAPPGTYTVEVDKTGVSVLSAQCELGPDGGTVTLVR
jgi:RNA polymerase sigma-70 factor (ECF subfamily)